MAKAQFIFYLLHKTDLSDAVIAERILEIGREKFGSSMSSLSGHDVNKWVNGNYNIPKWAILSSFLEAMEQNYYSEKEEDWDDFIRTWEAVFKPDSYDSMILQMREKGVFQEIIPSELSARKQNTKTK